MDHEKLAASRRLIEDSAIEPGQRYRRYKGDTYEVVALAIDEPTLEPLVIYKSLEDDHSTIWSGRLEDWRGHVASLGSPRFSRLRE